MTSTVICNGMDEIIKSNVKSPASAGSLKLSDMPSPSLDSGLVFICCFTFFFVTVQHSSMLCLNSAFLSHKSGFE
jgi:hypothetical protein